MRISSRRHLIEARRREYYRRSSDRTQGRASRDAGADAAEEEVRAVGGVPGGVTAVGCLHIRGGCDESRWRKNEAMFAPRGVVLSAFRDAFGFHCLDRHEEVGQELARGALPHMFVFVDGRYDRLSANAGLKRVLKQGATSGKRVALFTQLDVIAYMGQKHTMADVMIEHGGGRYIPKTYTPSHPPPMDRKVLKGLWFLKPSRGSEGRGIVVVEDVDPTYEGYRLLHDKPAVLQRGIDSPMLIKGHKFDVRVWCTLRGDGYYVVHRDGRLRVSSRAFANRDDQDLSTHITNVAAQPGGAWRNTFPCKLSELEPRLYESFNSQVNDIIGRVLALVFAHVARRFMTQQFRKKNGVRPADVYHLIGWDFIIDSRERVYLLELNTRPGAHKADDGYCLYEAWGREAAAFAIAGCSCACADPAATYQTLTSVPGLNVQYCLPVPHG